MTRTRLDKNQLQAIEHGPGPLLIIAGAGTGKTTVITERIKYLILNKKVPPSQILALTFTEKAAFEMQERVDVLLPYGYVNLWIDTFHGFCDRILRDEAHFIGLDPNYKLISESESILFLRQHIFDLQLKRFKPMGNPTKFLDALLVHFSRLKDEDISPSEYVAWARIKNSDPSTPSSGPRGLRSKNTEGADAQQYVELANAYKIYEELKVKESVMDFSDLISNTLQLFRTRKNILKRYQNQFRFILVDEFQDTNYAQNELAILLSEKNKNINVVADDDQSIYRFRGAAVSNVLQFKKTFPKAKIVTLIKNYRSTQTILDSAYTLIQHNNPNRLEVVEHINKKLISKLSGAGAKATSRAQLRDKPIQLIHENRAEDESDVIAKTIKTLSKKYAYKDMAILVRANNHSQGITTALQRHRIPYQFLGPGYLFQQEEIKDLIAYLTFLTDLSNSVALFRVLSMDIFGIPYVELNYLLNFAKKQNLSLFESLENTNQTFLSKQTQVKLDNFRKMAVRHLEKSKKEQAGQILYYFLIDSKLFETLNDVDSLRDERRVQNIAKFFDRIKNFETERSDSNIFTLVEWLTLMMQMGDSPTAADIDLHDRNAVNILTVHSSKGLEFKVVFLVNLVSDRFPSRERAEKIPLPQELIKEKLAHDIDFHLQEERRLFYVGMTRAKELLYFTGADFYGAGRRCKKLSPFIYEALPFFQKMEQSVKPTNPTLSNALSAYKAKDEIDEHRLPLKITYVNYSNLQMFDICPLHYKAKVILNIPTPKSPVQSFGISMHNTLYDFYKEVQNGRVPTLPEFRKMLQREWLTEGYQNKRAEQERYQQALKILKTFYKTECHPPVKPLGIELKFSFVLKNGVKVSGKIDRVDRRSEGGGIEIIDYKTGEDNPKAKAAHELQLAMYALAATKVKDELLNRKPEDITLTLHFLEGNTKKSMNFTKEDLEKFEDELVAKIKEIENSDFKCSGNVLCLNCEYRILCHS